MRCDTGKQEMPASTPISEAVSWARRRFQQTTLGILLALPLIAVLAGLLLFPVLHAVSMSLQDKQPGAPGVFVGLENYVELFTSDVAARMLVNTLVYAAASVGLKTVLGLLMAFVLNERIFARNLVRGWLLLPWMAPPLVVALMARWMFDQTGGVINYLLSAFHLVSIPPAWFASSATARIALIAANTWRGFPFFGVTLLAGLQSIPSDLYEAADVDGASLWHKIWHVTLPWLEPVLLTVVLLSTIWTFNDFTTVWIMTNGGPSNSTHLFSTYAFQVAFRENRMGFASAVSLVSTPLMLILIALLAPRMWRENT
jgi:multiple sugar transport system permease protein